MSGDYVVTIGSSDARTIPLRYSNTNDSGLKATIVAGGENQFRFELHAEPE
jgi:hypothetical protein